MAIARNTVDVTRFNRSHVPSARGVYMVEAYRKAKQVEGLQEASIYEAMLTLGYFQRLIGPDSSKQVNQPAIDKFVLDQGGAVALLRRLHFTPTSGPRRRAPRGRAVPPGL